jgi:hypothetical protein
MFKLATLCNTNIFTFYDTNFTSLLLKYYKSIIYIKIDKRWKVLQEF